MVTLLTASNWCQVFGRVPQGCPTGTLYSVHFLCRAGRVISKYVKSASPFINENIVERNLNDTLCELCNLNDALCVLCNNFLHRWGQAQLLTLRIPCNLGRFNVRKDILSQYFAKPQTRSILCRNVHIALKFCRHLGTTAAETPAEF